MSVDIKSQIFELIAKQLNIKKEDIKPNMEFVKDLKADSLDIVEIVMTLEEHFDLQIPDEKAEKMRTAGDLVSYIEGEKKTS